MIKISICSLLLLLTVQAYSWHPEREKISKIDNPVVEILKEITTEEGREVFGFRVTGKALKFKRKILRRFHRNKYVLKKVSHNFQMNQGEYGHVNDTSGKWLGGYNVYNVNNTAVASYWFFDTMDSEEKVVEIGRIVTRENKLFLEISDNSPYSCFHYDYIAQKNWSEGWFHVYEQIRCQLTVAELRKQ